MSATVSSNTLSHTKCSVNDSAMPHRNATPLIITVTENTQACIQFSHDIDYLSLASHVVLKTNQSHDRLRNKAIKGKCTKVLNDKNEKYKFGPLNHTVLIKTDTHVKKNVPVFIRAGTRMYFNGPTVIRLTNTCHSVLYTKRVSHKSYDKPVNVRVHEGLSAVIQPVEKKVKKPWFHEISNRDFFPTVCCTSEIDFMPIEAFVQPDVEQVSSVVQAPPVAPVVQYTEKPIEVVKFEDSQDICES